MSFQSDLSLYMDSWGFPCPAPGVSSGNGIVYWAEALIIAQRCGELDKTLIAHCLDAIRLCEIQPGLYKRHPELFQVSSRHVYGSDQESIDDYAGLACIARLTGSPEIARNILLYGRKSNPEYYYPNETGPDSWDSRAWLGRFPSLVASLEWAAGESPGWLLRQWWSISMRFGGVSNNNSARLALVMAYARDDAYWQDIVNERVSHIHGSWSALYANYFQDSNHPFARYA